MQTYLVGGAVRDRLLGLEVSDRDWVVVGATPEAMQELGFLPVGKDFPVFLHPESKEEYALARTERKSGRGYKGFVFDASPEVSLEQDLRRRDLTINAIAQQEDGQLVDPYNGQRDLQLRVLRHVSPAFSEDPLRVLRVARFAARYKAFGFTVADETLQLMSEMARSGELTTLVAERVWQELHKALESTHPEVFIQVLRECQALQYVLPEVDALFGVPQTEKYHPEIDTGEHLLLALQQSARMNSSAKVRFAVLLHDLGKATSPPDKLPRHTGHEQRSGQLAKSLADRLKVPHEYSSLASLVAQWHTHVHRALELRPSTVLKLLRAVDVFRRPDRLDELLSACEADARGRAGLQQRAYPQANYVRDAWQCCLEVDVPSLQAQGYQGAALGEQIDKERLRLLAAYKAHYLKETNA